jgi:hypothetical protein
VRLFAWWCQEPYGEALRPETLTNEAVHGSKQRLLDQANKPKTINRLWLAAYAHWLEQAGYVKNMRNPVWIMTMPDNRVFLWSRQTATADERDQGKHTCYNLCRLMRLAFDLLKSP